MARCVFCKEICRENGYEGNYYRFAVCERCLEIADRIVNMVDAINGAVILSRETVIDGHILRMIEDGVLEKDDYEVGGGMTVPVCRICGSDRDIIVRDFDDGSWAYFCTRCDRAIPYEEFREGNP